MLARFSLALVAGVEYETDGTQGTCQFQEFTHTMKQQQYTTELKASQICVEADPR